ncbi:hypothetical protein GIB67_029814 [Kingdonia uniflora]|uniref:Uncharacterized protein n=1 Tax=Kingdonia uniflora TaxID=39325 RepID=A0A7J7NJ37_9MAGN|nr:hypothetical protein GIB67_029814 [Kingdonia uniflora]
MRPTHLQTLNSTTKYTVTQVIPKSGDTMFLLTFLRRSMPKTEENIVIRFSKFVRKRSQNGSTNSL